MYRTTRSSLTFSLLLVLVTSGALADPVSISVNTSNGMRTATDNSIIKNGVSYVHLGALISQVGGGVSVSQDRAQIDLSEKSAWLRDNNPQVSASLGIFQLASPIVKEGNDVLIAVNDIPAFFEKAFRVAANAQTLAAPAAPSPAAPAPAAPAAAQPVVEQPLPELDPVPLQPVAAPAPIDPPVEEVVLDPVEPLTPVAQAPADPAAPVAPVAVANPADPALTPVAQAPSPPVEVASATAVAAPNRPINRNIETIIIDAGHGGNDFGAQGPSGVKESALVLAVATKLQQALEQGSPLKTILTRDKDVPLGQVQRAILSNTNKGDLLVSLHTGGAFKPEARGCRLFVCGAGQGKFAASEYAQRSQALAGSVAAALQQGTQCTFGGIYSLDCNVVKDVGMPGFMIELGMVTNPEEEALLNSDDYQNKLAAAIAAGIKTYMETARTGSAQ